MLVHAPRLSVTSRRYINTIQPLNKGYIQGPRPPAPTDPGWGGRGERRSYVCLWDCGFLLVWVKSSALKVHMWECVCECLYHSPVSQTSLSCLTFAEMWITLLNDSVTLWYTFPMISPCASFTLHPRLIYVPGSAETPNSNQVSVRLGWRIFIFIYLVGINPGNKNNTMQVKDIPKVTTTNSFCIYIYFCECVSVELVLRLLRRAVWEVLELFLVDLSDDGLVGGRQHRVLLREVLVKVIHISFGFLRTHKSTSGKSLSKEL